MASNLNIITNVGMEYRQRNESITNVDNNYQENLRVRVKFVIPIKF